MAVRREIESVTGREVAVGAVYATLDRLEAKRLVSLKRTMMSGVSRRLRASAPKHWPNHAQCATSSGEA